MANLMYLPDWTVTDYEIDSDGAYRIPASYDVAPEHCAKCGTVGNLYKHGAKTTVYVDAPVHGRQTFIEVRRARYRCRDCGGTFMQDLPDMDDSRRMTVRCREYIAAQALLKPNTHVADDVGVDEKIVRQIGGVQWEQLRAVTKRDRYAKDNAYTARSQMQAITFDEQVGEISRVKVGL